MQKYGQIILPLLSSMLLSKRYFSHHYCLVIYSMDMQSRQKLYHVYSYFPMHISFALSDIINSSSPRGINDIIQTYTTCSYHIIWYKSSLVLILLVLVRGLILPFACSLIPDGYAHSKLKITFLDTESNDICQQFLGDQFSR